MRTARVAFAAAVVASCCGIAACDASGHRTASERAGSSTAVDPRSSTSGLEPSTAAADACAPEGVDPGGQAHVAPLDLSAYGFRLDDDREWRGERGNRVTLRRYVGPRVPRPTPDPSGLARDAIYINTARVTGLGTRVRASLDALVAPDGTNPKRQQVRVHGRPALLLTGEGGRYVAFALGDWYVQVSVDAPLDVLSNDDLIAIAQKVVLR